MSAFVRYRGFERELVLLAEDVQEVLAEAAATLHDRIAELEDLIDRREAGENGDALRSQWNLDRIARREPKSHGVLDGLGDRREPMA